MADYTGRRITKTNSFEEWCFYKSNYRYVDRVLIFFGQRLNKIYLITSHKNVNMEHKYISIIVNLVHDLENDYDIEIQKVDINNITDDAQIDDMIDEATEKIKLANNLRNH